MAIDTVDKRRNIAMVYFVPDGAIDTEAERKAVLFIYKTDTAVISTVVIDFNTLKKTFRFSTLSKTFRYTAEKKKIRFNTEPRA